ncbi:MULTISPECIES: LapA family protein [Kitasatospora]|uniref:LapA family protein n=1 Tax=Kitasatospora acidiphila TaxID=2567942 RepID=A0A540WDF9_9ACTN|nr:MULTISPECIES: LapA family protein [Kitasatospora]MDH6144400.1 putative integral membrane protein [Kitasatospora sp. GP30]TQF06434.1 LapA family protein [Kitasatospora acidiphila]
MTRNPGRQFDGRKKSDIAGVPTSIVVGVVTALLALWFLLANLERVKIQFWFFTVTAPLWIALAATLLIGGVLGWVLKGRRENR